MTTIKRIFVRDIAMLSVLALSACGSSTTQQDLEPITVELTPVGNEVGILAMPVIIQGKIAKLVIATEAGGPALSADLTFAMELDLDRELTINDASGSQTEMRLTQSASISPVGGEFASTLTPFVVFERDLSSIGIDGMVPPQLFSEHTCLEISFTDQTATFHQLPCRIGDEHRGRIDLNTGNLMDANNRLFFTGTNPHGVEGKMIVATGSEFSLFPPKPVAPTDDIGDCKRVSSITGDECVSFQSDATITVGDVTLKSSRARELENLPTENNVVGVIGADMLQNAVLKLSADENTLIIQSDDN